MAAAPLAGRGGKARWADGSCRRPLVPFRASSADRRQKEHRLTLDLALLEDAAAHIRQRVGASGGIGDSGAEGATGLSHTLPPPPMQLVSRCCGARRVYWRRSACADAPRTAPRSGSHIGLQPHRL